MLHSVESPKPECSLFYLTWIAFTKHYCVNNPVDKCFGQMTVVRFFSEPRLYVCSHDFFSLKKWNVDKNVENQKGAV